MGYIHHAKLHQNPDSEKHETRKCNVTLHLEKLGSRFVGLNLDHIPHGMQTAHLGVFIS